MLVRSRTGVAFQKFRHLARASQFSLSRDVLASRFAVKKYKIVCWQFERQNVSTYCASILFQKLISFQNVSQVILGLVSTGMVDHFIPFDSPGCPLQLLFWFGDDRSERSAANSRWTRGRESVTLLLSTFDGILRFNLWPDRDGLNTNSIEPFKSYRMMCVWVAPIQR